MEDLHKIGVKHIEPIVELLKAHHQYGELSIPDIATASKATRAAAVEAIYVGLQPTVIAQDEKGCWTVTVGGAFVASLIAFVNDQFVYPMDGEIEALQGKRFSELARMAQHKIAHTHVRIQLYEYRAGVGRSTVLSFDRLVGLIGDCG